MSVVFKGDYRPPNCEVHGCVGDAGWNIPFCVGHWRVLPRAIQKMLRRYQKSDPLCLTARHQGNLGMAKEIAVRGTEV